jgi:hypothetical protein
VTVTCLERRCPGGLFNSSCSFLSCSWFKFRSCFPTNRFYFRFLRQVHAPARLVLAVRKSNFLPCSSPCLCAKRVEISYCSWCVLQRFSGSCQVTPAHVAAKLGPPVQSRVYRPTAPMLVFHSHSSMLMFGLVSAIALGSPVTRSGFVV